MRVTICKCDRCGKLEQSENDTHCDECKRLFDEVADRCWERINAENRRNLDIATKGRVDLVSILRMFATEFRAQSLAHFGTHVVDLMDKVIGCEDADAERPNIYSAK